MNRGEIDAYTTWDELSCYHSTIARHDTWVRNGTREHAETLFCDRGLHMVHTGISFSKGEMEKVPLPWIAGTYQIRQLFQNFVSRDLF